MSRTTPVKNEATTPTTTMISPSSEIMVVLNGGAKTGLILLPIAIYNPYIIEKIINKITKFLFLNSAFTVSTNEIYYSNSRSTGGARNRKK